MKKIILGIFTLLISFQFISCDGEIDNSVKFQNGAQESILVNFRGEAIRVAPGKTAEVKNIPRGTYTYNTTYTIPANAESSNAEGALSGNIVISAGTKVLIIYSSAFIEGNYIISATYSSSDDQSTDTGTSP